MHPWPGAHLSQANQNRAAEGGTGRSVEKLPGPKDPLQGLSISASGRGFIFTL